MNNDLDMVRIDFESQPIFNRLVHVIWKLDLISEDLFDDICRSRVKLEWIHD